ncbi:FecR domain-containing protein [Candidatus Woesearchaeota archaeon]|nr:FecR domain-containing protein [Candidatus Woesearchaeota archaeon]
MNKLIAALVILLVACTQAQETKVRETYSATITLITKGVTVNGLTATLGQGLRAGDIVKTVEKAETAIEFFDGGILRMRENTEITIQELNEESKKISIRQAMGETWTRLLKIAGVTQYDIETPNAVASVRGTGFKVEVTGEKTEVSVADGTVHVARIVDEQVVATVDVSEDQEAVVEQQEGIAAADLSINVHTAEEDPWIEENLQEDEQYIEEVQEEYIQEHPEILDELKEKGIDEQHIDEAIEDVINGEIPEEKLVQHAESLEKEPAEIKEETPIHETVEQIDETITDQSITDVTHEIVAPDEPETHTGEEPQTETTPEEPQPANNIEETETSPETKEQPTAPADSISG